MKKILVIACVAFALVAGSCGNKRTAGTDSTSVASDTVENEVAEQTDSVAVTDSLPTVVDFYATWCGPCKHIAPVFEELKEQYKGKANFVSIDVDQQSYEARRFGVEAMPTFVFLDTEGNEIDRIVGADADALREYTKQLCEGTLVP